MTLTGAPQRKIEHRRQPSPPYPMPRAAFIGRTAGFHGPRWLSHSGMASSTFGVLRGFDESCERRRRGVPTCMPSRKPRRRCKCDLAEELRCPRCLRCRSLQDVPLFMRAAMRAALTTAHASCSTRTSTELKGVHLRAAIYGDPTHFAVRVAACGSDDAEVNGRAKKTKHAPRCGQVSFPVPAISARLLRLRPATRPHGVCRQTRAPLPTTAHDRAALLRRGRLEAPLRTIPALRPEHMGARSLLRSGFGTLHLRAFTLILVQNARRGIEREREGAERVLRFGS